MMNREHILAILYDLTLAIGSEVRLEPMLTKVLQRILYHTNFPVGVVLLDQARDEAVVHARLAAAIGDHVMAGKVGQTLDLPHAVAQGGSELLHDTAPGRVISGDDHYPYCLKLPIDASASILLFSAKEPSAALPLTEVFVPVLRNLSKAIVLCTNYESETRTLAFDRDQAVTALESAYQQTERERALLDALMNGIPDIITLKDQNGIYLACNSRFEELVGVREEDIVGRSLHEFAPAGVADVFREKDDAAIAANRPLTNDHWLTFARDGYRGVFEITKMPMRSADGTLVGILSIAHDVTKRKAAEERIHHLSHHDVLTGLLNRFSFQERASQALLSARRDGRKLAVLLIDEDHFKYVNDTMGHNAGDLLLVEIARRLRNCVGENDIVARLGGDEFAVALTAVESATAAAEVAMDILRSIAVPYHINRKPLHSTGSLGISIFPMDGDNIEVLLKNADTAMYHAKENGRNNFQFFSTDMSKAVAERMELERDLREGIAAQQFELYYQPKILTTSQRPFGFEALIRWHHPRHGLVAPTRFIPLAEETGLIEPLGEWMLDAACRQLALWEALGFDNLQMAANISCSQLQSATLADRVGSIMAKHHIKPGKLELEVTETMAMANVERAMYQLHALRQHGVNLAIDDFGTGYSSMAYLKQMPIKTLKLDRAFVQDIETDRSDAALCGGIIALAHSLDLRVVAEGVETPSQRDFLVAHGCDFLQGFLYSEPLPAAQATDYLYSRMPATA